ncbi:MAG TPA: integrin alpha, partial [Anaerolineae bacterium]|nr:integrin alpha [Anaerolineae bacterium]
DFTGVVTFTYVISEGGGVLAEQKISDTEGGFGGGLSNSDYFGIDGQYIGDIDGDGIGDIAIGATSDDDGGTDRGAVWILFLNRDGTVKSKQKISATQGGFGTGLDNQDYFGNSVTSLGDLDLDGVGDIAVGAFYDGDGGYTRGAVWILFLNRDGTIKAKQKISDIQGGFTGVLMNEDKFGVAVGQIGDLNGDGIVDIAVGAYGDDEGGSDRGAIWILFLNRDGTVISHQKINDTQGGFAGDLDNGDTFGNEIALLGDIDNDGFIEIAVGAYFDDDGGLNRGAVWILSIDENGIVQKYQKISDTVGGFGNQLSNGDFFGIDFSVLPDMNGDGINDLIVGAIGDDGGGSDRGAAWVLFLTEIGTVSEAYIINDLKGGFDGELTNSDYLGDLSIGIGDLDNNGVTDFGLGARNDDDGGGNRGAIWLTFMKPHGEAEVEVTIIVESACTIPERVINNEIDLSTPDVYFNWDENGATAYELWRSSDPYFMVGAGDAVVEDTVTAVPAVHLNGAGDVNSNYYYGIVAVGSCGDRAALSSRLGAFDYGLVRGQ